MGALQSSIRRTLISWALMLLAALAFTACSSSGDDAPLGAVRDGGAPPPEAAPETSPDGAAFSSSSGLAERPGQRRETTGNVPHMQLGAAPVPGVDSELRRLVFLLPGVEERESARSLPGAAGLWLSDGLDLARGEVLGDSREIAHIHPDGSMHVFLPVDLAMEVDQAKWGELHPWVERDGFWDGVAMVYTPETLDEVEVAFGLVVASYNFIVGADIDPSMVG